MSEWKNQGKCLDNELEEVIKNQDLSTCKYFVAYFTDGFLSGFVGEGLFEKIDVGKLLELRIFGEEKELLALRSAIGNNSAFAWRIACEEGMKEDTYLKREQTLDIDETRSAVVGDEMEIMSTGGGSYRLPITPEEKKVVVISYVKYDSDGLAQVYDNRMAGFAK